jgi:hypothetical protein
MDQYPTIDRFGIVVIPQQPFCDWLNKIDTSIVETLSGLHKDCNIYLIPDYENEHDMEKAIQTFIKKNFSDIFRHELSEWYLDESVFPAITYKNFLEWFRISTHTMIFDMVEEPIEREDSI